MRELTNYVLHIKSYSIEVSLLLGLSPNPRNYTQLESKVEHHVTAISSLSLNVWYLSYDLFK